MKHEWNDLLVIKNDDRKAVVGIDQLWETVIGWSLVAGKGPTHSWSDAYVSIIVFLEPLLHGSNER